MIENKNNQDEVDLSGMLSGYSKKAEQFQSWRQQTNQKTNQTSQKNSTMIRLLIKYSGGLIRDERQARYAFLVFASIILILSLVLFFKIGVADSPKDLKILPA